MFEKHQFYEDNPFMDDLTPDEEVLWTGQPDAGKWFTQGDLLFVPFSLLWGGFALFWNVMVWSSNAPPFFRLWGLPFLLVGFYIVFGRFLYKAWRKRRTYYAVTNKRLLILTKTWSHNLSSFYLNTLPNLNKNVGGGGVGNITFGSAPAPSMWRRQSMNMSNTGFEFGGYQIPGFYDIHHVNEVYALINELHDQYLQPRQDDIWEESKPKRRR